MIKRGDYFIVILKNNKLYLKFYKIKKYKYMHKWDLIYESMSENEIIEMLLEEHKNYIKEMMELNACINGVGGIENLFNMIYFSINGTK